MMPFAVGTLLEVKGFGPGGAFARAVGELVERLQQELRAGRATVDTALFAAASRDRCDPGERLQLCGGLEAFSVRAKGHEQPRGESRTGARQGEEQGRIRMLVHELAEAVFVALDGLRQGTQLADQALHLEHAGLNQGPVRGQRNRGLHEFQPLDNPFFVAGVVGLVELAERSRRGSLDRSQRGPLAEEVTGQWAIDIVSDEHHRLWKIPFQHGCQLIRQTGSLIDGIAAGLGQELQLARSWCVGLPHTELIPVPQEIIEQ
jgi:hypothetical protein